MIHHVIRELSEIEAIALGGSRVGDHFDENQLIKAKKRGCLNSFSHRIAAFLETYFGILLLGIVRPIPVKSG